MIRAAVLGSPISHSLSPTLHRTAYKCLGVDGQYEAIDVDVARLRDFMASLDESWTGLSLTMPLKEEILSIATEVDDLARRINSANTLLRTVSGWKAVTTDVNGFTQALLAHDASDFHSLTIIGSGATARSAAAACDRSGLKIRVIHRSAERETSMRKAAPLSELIFLPWGAELTPTDLLINATPAGVADSYCEGLDEDLAGVYFEALYNPWPTKFLAKWRSLKGYGIDGLDLLIHQGIDQVSLMTGLAVDRAELAPILRTACLAAM